MSPAGEKVPVSRRPIRVDNDRVRGCVPPHGHLTGFSLRVRDRPLPRRCRTSVYITAFDPEHRSVGITERIHDNWRHDAQPWGAVCVEEFKRVCDESEADCVGDIDVIDELADDILRAVNELWPRPSLGWRTARDVWDNRPRV